MSSGRVMVSFILAPRLIVQRCYHEAADEASARGAHLRKTFSRPQGRVEIIEEVGGGFEAHTEAHAPAILVRSGLGPGRTRREADGDRQALEPAPAHAEAEVAQPVG